MMLICYELTHGVKGGQQRLSEGDSVAVQVIYNSATVAPSSSDCMQLWHQPTTNSTPLTKHASIYCVHVRQQQLHFTSLTGASLPLITVHLNSPQTPHLLEKYWKPGSNMVFLLALLN